MDYRVSRAKNPSFGNFLRLRAHGAASFEFRAGMPDCLHWFYSDNEEKASRRRIGENIAMEFDSPMLQQLWAE